MAVVASKSHFLNIKYSAQLLVGISPLKISVLWMLWQLLLQYVK